MDESWLIPYADLLTLLLALFIVLFASSQIDQKKFDEIRKSFVNALSGGMSFFVNSTPVPANKDVGIDRTGSEAEKAKDPGELEKQRTKETEELLELKRKMDQFIDEKKLTAQLKTHLDNQQLKITISDNTLFPSGSARLKPESIELAAAVSELLEQYKDYEVIVAGHTDNVPINTLQYPSNFHLSTERALNLLGAILLNKNVGPERFSSVGYGEYRPVASNKTEEGRAKNRRVEVSIVRNIQ
jgi:chemotaxis protein MotB